MGSNRSVLGLTVPLLVLAAVPSALVSAGATRADASTCGSLNRATGPAAAGELSNAAFVSAGESWAVGNVGSALKSNQRLTERFNGSAWSVVPSPNQGTGIGSSNAPDSLLIGNAAGGFTTMTIPQTAVGSGNRAYPVDYTHDGLSSFLVLNGQVPNPGPIQLLTPQPTSMRALTRTVSFHSGAVR
jgi:hypothetical protein